jgi:hydroxyacyl-ACP dehydratase HTD2-like protein with hotdog domain
MSGLITPELKAHVGRQAPPRREVVTRRDIRKYALSTGTRIRKHLDGDEAPPLYHVALFWDVVELDQLTPDGVSVDTLLPKLPLDRAMAGGLQIDYFRPIRPGDVLVARRTLTDLYEKSGRSGPLIFYEITLDVATEDNDPVLREITTRILR